MTFSNDEKNTDVSLSLPIFTISFSDPTPTVDPLLNNKTWQAFDCYGNETNFLNIDLDMEMETDFFFKNMDFSQRLYDELGDGHYYTY